MNEIKIKNLFWAIFLSWMVFTISCSLIVSAIDRNTEACSQSKQEVPSMEEFIKVWKSTPN